MPFVPQVQRPSLIARQSVTTTTVTASPTSGQPVVSTDSSPTTPVAAIVGGAIGGALLALLVVIGWVWWGRSIQRKQHKILMKRASAAHGRSSMRSARPSISSSISSKAPTRESSEHQPPLWAGGGEKRVTFASDKIRTAKPVVQKTGNASGDGKTLQSRIERPRMLSPQGTSKHVATKQGVTRRPILMYPNPHLPSQIARPGQRPLPSSSSLPQRWSRLLGLHNESLDNVNTSDPAEDVRKTIEPGRSKATRSFASRVRVQPRLHDKNRTSLMTTTTASVYSEHGPDPVGVAYGGEDYDCFIVEETEDETHADAVSRYLDYSEGRLH